MVRSKIRLYYCYVRLYFDEDGEEMYELDVFDSEPGFKKDGYNKYLGESPPIESWSDEPFDDYRAPIELARDIIRRHELKDHLENSIRYHNGIYPLESEERKKEEVLIYDHETQSAKQTKDFYLSDISKLDELQPYERAELFKQFPELKFAYKQHIRGVKGA
ncbi:hypothetical protein [Lihuaxuella thermophila]|nr:hypothetical protein [Lihuaxuella thermophila]